VSGADLRLASVTTTPVTTTPVTTTPASTAAQDVETTPEPDMVLRDCLPDTPLHAMLSKAVGKGAWQVYVGTHQHGDPDTRYWDRHRVGQTLQNGDFLTVGAAEMVRTLDMTPPLEMTHPGERLLHALRWMAGNVNAMAQATIDGTTTWWYVEYTHKGEYLQAEQRKAADDYPRRHANPY
jgi:hypothetical protein